MKKCAKCGCICDDATNFCTACGSNQFEAVETVVQNAASEIEAAAENLNQGSNETVGVAEEKTVAAVEEIKNVATEPISGTDRPAFAPVMPLQPENETQPQKDNLNRKKEKPEKSTKPVPTGLFFLFDILLAIPLVNLICTLVFSAFAKNLNVQHFWKSKLIWIIIFVVLAILSLVLGLVFKNQLLEIAQPLINAVQKALNA